ncbi:hypothetical protein D3C77_770430 [compost metagenome]
MLRLNDFMNKGLRILLQPFLRFLIRLESLPVGHDKPMDELLHIQLISRLMICRCRQQSCLLRKQLSKMIQNRFDGRKQ